MAAAENTLTLPARKEAKDKRIFTGPPTSKVGTGAIAASVTTLLLPLWRKVTGFDLTANPESVIALTTLITFLIQYLVPDKE